MSEKSPANIPGALTHAILLTDGKDEHETAEELGEKSASAKANSPATAAESAPTGASRNYGRSRPHCIGTVDIVADPADLADDFAAMMRDSMDKSIPDLTLRLWTPAGARVAFVKQVAPTVEDLTHRRVDAGSQIRRISAWALGVTRSATTTSRSMSNLRDVGREKLAARVTVIAGDQNLGEGLVKAMWTTDTGLSARISRPRRALHGSGGARASGSGGAGRTEERRHLHRDRKSATARWNSLWNPATTERPSCSGRHRGRRAHWHRPATPRCRRGRRDGARRAIDSDRTRTEGGLMPTCSEGHVTEATDYCTVCGSPVQPRRPSRIRHPRPRNRARHAAHRSAVASVRRAATTRPCPHRRDSAIGRAMPASVEWTAIVTADQDYYKRVIARGGPDTVEFPEFFPERRITLRRQHLDRAHQPQARRRTRHRSRHPAPSTAACPRNTPSCRSGTRA